jgi:type I restriction enzyme, S subunit
VSETRLPPSWIWTTLGEMCTHPQYGYTTKAAESGDTLFLRTTDITSGNIDWTTVPYCAESPADPEKYLLREGDIVISRAGSVGFSYLIQCPPKAVFASYLIRFRPFIAPRYFILFLKSPFYWDSISKREAGIAVGNVNAQKLAAVPLPLPPLPEQKRIVAKIEELFSELDAGEESLRVARRQLGVYRQSLLKQAFEGKLTEKWRAENPDKIESPARLLSRIHAIHPEHKFPQSLTSEELNALPALPTGFQWARVGEISDAIGGFAFSSGEFRESGSHQVIKIANVRMGRIRLEERPSFVDAPDRKIIFRYGLRYGDCVISLTGTRNKRDYGFVAMIRNETNLLLNQRLGLIRFFGGIEPRFYELALGSKYFQNYFFAQETGNVGQGNVSMKAISHGPIPLCSLPEQEEIVRLLDEQFEEIERNEREIDAALRQSEVLRQAILHRAFTGRLVPQDPTDEPAAELLARVKAEREAATNKAEARPSLPRRQRLASAATS